METLSTVLFVLQVLVAMALIGFILIQQGKGADAGAAFGSGASSTVFGSQGSGNFLTKTTTVLAMIFLANSLTLAYLAKERVKTARDLNLDVDTTIEQTVDDATVIPDEIPAIPETDSEIPAVPE